jgi:hypothetical protein
MIKPLPIKKQIEILEKVKSNLLWYGCDTGLCTMISQRMFVWISYRDIPEYFPSFTRENAFKLSEKYGFTKPHKHSNYWWRMRTTKSRLAFVNALLKELKEK